ncbi:glycosyltransferase [Sphingobacterium sp. xlx-130]|uniref:glycosyltransferase n=1 Tax=Sphingobacterium sp. xlx-130 TaxID=2654323 RepID=UPI0013DA3FA8|nr:glycosyltransferase [Sphingobacterium sp. xlx-130]
MEIAIYLDDYSGLGGVEKVTLDLANALSVYYSVTIISRTKSAISPVFDYSDKVIVLDSFKGKSLDVLSEVLKQHKIKSLIVQIQNLSKCYRIVKKVQRDLGIKVFSVLHSSPNAYLKFLESFGAVSLLGVAKRMKFSLYWKPLNFFLLKKIVRISTKFICISEGAMKEMYMIFSSDFLEDKVILIYNILYTDSEKVDFVKKENLIVYGGRLSKDKRVDLLVKNWIELKRYHGQWRFEIYGDGSELEELKRQIAKSGLTNIHLMGVSNGMLDVLSRSKICLLYSVVEGLPTILYEAALMGNVLVSYNSYGGASDLVKHRSNGFVVNNEVELQSTLKMILNRDIDLNILSNNNAKVLSSFNNEDVVNSWIDLIGVDE